jgi:hypothetical protein
MSGFDLTTSLARAQQRLGASKRRGRRSDAGERRIAPAALRELRSLLLGQERPRIAEVLRRIQQSCRCAGVRPPSRATVYDIIARGEGHSYRIDGLPPAVRMALYNLDPKGSVPGHQLVLYCFSFGSVQAVSFAAGLPWLDLYQADRVGGWRPRSKGLLRAVLRARGIA